jgi:hypothetical protein
MNESNITLLGNFTDPEQIDFEGMLSFAIKADYIAKDKFWKSKDVAAEFLGNFWKQLLDVESIKATLHFVCSELMENAVNHSINSDYIVVMQLCFKSDELLVYVTNKTSTEKAEVLKSVARLILECDNLQELFIQRMKETKRTGSKKSQVGLITIIKDRGVELSWKLEQQLDITAITTLARISIKGKDPV